MPYYSPDADRRRSYGRQDSSGSDDHRDKRRRRFRDRSLDRRQPSDRDGQRMKDEARARQYEKRRSRSPRIDRRNVQRERRSISASPEPRHRSRQDERRHSKRDRSLSRSPPIKRDRRDSRGDRGRRHRQLTRRSRSPLSRPPPSKRSNAPLPSQEAAYNKDPTSDAMIKPPPEVEKQKANYAPTGKLAAETNTVANTSIVLKYNEPPESRLPPASAPWRLYVFKGSETLESLPLHQRSCWLFGRERAVVDHPTEHPSCSKQHAVLQFRYTEKKNEWGEKKGGVKPYVIDLESANGTRVNGDKIPERRYVEVRSGDVITFGESTREYVILVPPKEEKKT